MRYSLIVNGTVYAKLKSIESLKNIALQIKHMYKDAIISIEDRKGINIHYFF